MSILTRWIVLRVRMRLAPIVPACLALLLSTGELMASPSLSDYELVFADEFTGSALDGNKWNTAPIWGPYIATNGEEQFYLDTLGLHQNPSYSPFQFDGDNLIISATPVSPDAMPVIQPAESDGIWENYPEYQYNPQYQESDPAYLSGIITSSDSFNFTHGYAEIRAQVPAGQGLWSAFWLLSTKYVEDVPEIDIMEHLGQYPNEVNHTLHYFDTSNDWALVSTPTYKTAGPDYTAGFHTYGVAWSIDSVVWYVDGAEVHRVSDADFLIAKQSMYLLANLAVGGTWPGSPDESTVFPANYTIDYIRVYKKTPPEVVTSAVLANDYQLVFSDEFGGSALDPTKWKTSHLWGPYLQINNEEQIYIDTLDRHSTNSVDPFNVANGVLTITAETLSAADRPEQPEQNDPEWQLYPTHQYNADYETTWTPGYSSGLISSYDSFKFVNGYVEFRAKVPEGSGLWPAFWLLNGYYVGNLPEIDVMELRGSEPQTVHHTYHYFNPVGELVSSPETTTISSGKYSDDFHTYGVQWDPGVIKWYIDGQVVRTLNDSNVSTQLMYIIANLAVGGNFVDPVDASFPRQLEIDYIRAYQLETTSDSSTTSPAHLTLDTIDPYYYGYNYQGVYENRESVEFTFDQHNQNLTLSLTGYDIDDRTEVRFFVNDTFVSTLAATGNNREKKLTLVIPADIQVNGVNTLRMDQSVPGWRWGVSNLLLSENSAYPELIIDAEDNEYYGYNVSGIFDHRESAIFTFANSEAELQLKLLGHDIDTGTEVEVLLNGSSVGFLSRTPNNGNGSSTMALASPALAIGENTIEFRQSVPGWKWGVSNLLLFTDSELPVDLALTVDVEDNNLYGYNYNGVFDHRNSVSFVFDGGMSDLILTLSTFDIDSGNEVTVKLNDATVGNLATTPNNGSGSSTIEVPLSAQSVGTNTLSFVQKIPGWKWGISDLLLTEGSAGITLERGVVNTEKYGYNYDDIFSHREFAEFKFAGGPGDLTLSLTGYDIDAGTEVAVLVNGESIGYLVKSVNNGSISTSLLISSADQFAGVNTLRFEQLVSGWRWGITDLLLQ